MENQLTQLEPEEQRVLGALIEKSITTPDVYPLTLNSLTTACNQKSARNPVVDYDQETVVMALNGLKKKELSGTETGAYSRSAKYAHRLQRMYLLTDPEIAIICLLLLRGPQTPGELKSNAGRLYSFGSLQQVQECLNDMASADVPYVVETNKKPGQKETRFRHLFSEANEEENYTETENTGKEPARKHVSEMEQRIVNLETEVQDLREKLNKLLEELT